MGGLQREFRLEPKHWTQEAVSALETWSWEMNNGDFKRRGGLRASAASVPPPRAPSKKLKQWLRLGIPDSSKRQVWAAASGARALCGTSPDATYSAWHAALGAWHLRCLRAAFGPRGPPACFAREMSELGAPLFAEAAVKPPRSCPEAAEMEGGLGLGQPAYSASRASLEAFVPFISVLSTAGVTAALRTLWVLRTLHPFSECSFCPLIPVLVCLALLFCEEPETLAIASSVLQRSSAERRWNPNRLYLATSLDQANRAARHLVLVLRRHEKSLLRHLEVSLAVDIHEHAACWLADGLASAGLPLRYLLRLHSVLFVEGSKVFVRACLALVRARKVELKACRTIDEANAILKQLGSFLSDDGEGRDALINSAYKALLVN